AARRLETQLDGETVVAARGPEAIPLALGLDRETQRPMAQVVRRAEQEAKRELTLVVRALRNAHPIDPDAHLRYRVALSVEGLTFDDQRLLVLEAGECRAGEQEQERGDRKMRGESHTNPGCKRAPLV